MKKLLTVSVLAIMAVSAANADIASTTYVNSQTGAGENGDITYTGTTYLDSVGDLKAADVELDKAVKGNADAIDAVEGRMGAAEGKITTLEGTVAGHTESITTLGTTVEQIKQGTGVNKATKNAAGIVQVGENINVSDGVISVATAGQGTPGIVELATYDTVGQTNNFSATDNTKAVTGEAVAKYMDGVISEYDNSLSDIRDTVEMLPETYAPINTVEEAEQTAINTAAEAITETIGSGFTKDSTVASQLGAVRTTAENAMNWAALQDASYTAAGCNAANAVCSLVSKGGAISWEKVAE